MTDTPAKRPAAPARPATTRPVPAQKRTRGAIHHEALPEHLKKRAPEEIKLARAQMHPIQTPRKPR